jgi:hypothetical protein
LGKLTEVSDVIIVTRNRVSVDWVNAADSGSVSDLLIQLDVVIVLSGPSSSLPLSSVVVVVGHPVIVITWGAVSGDSTGASSNRWP